MFYRFEKITPRITRIWDVSHTAIYLIEGSESALVVDTGVGAGSLRAAVESLTAKPVTVLLTHGHVDHAMGAGEFDTVYLHSADKELYLDHSQLGVRMGHVQGAVQQGGDAELIAKVQPGDYLPVKAVEEFLPLEWGKTYSLGDISVQAIAAPGHTPGSTVLLIPEERILILGDACNGFTFLFDASCPSVAQYREMLLGLQKETAGKYDRCLFSHGMGEGTVDMIANVIAVCDDILAGKVDNMPFRGFNGEPAFIAKAMDFARFCRADGGEGNVVYNPEKIH